MRIAALTDFFKYAGNHCDWFHQKSRLSWFDLVKTFTQLYIKIFVCLHGLIFSKESYLISMEEVEW